MKNDRIMEKRGIFLFSLVFTLCFFFMISGRELEQHDNISWTFSYFFKVGFLSILGGFFSGTLFTKIFLMIEEKGKKTKRKELKVDWKFFLISFVLICLSWLPFFLAYYPGNCTYDIGGQTWYIVSGHYEAHHPIAHTLLIGGFLKLGNLLGNVNLGMGMYVIFQMLWLAFSFSLSIVFLAKRNIKWCWIIFLQLWCMFFIPNAYMSISTTKDVIFTAETLLMSLFFFKILLEGKNTIELGRWDILFFINGVLMCLFRNNGKYALIVLIIILACIVLFSSNNKKLYVRLFLCSIGIFIFGNILLAFLSKATAATEIRKEEMLSVPIQQLCRVVKYHGDELSEEEYEFLDGCFPEKAHQRYIPSVSDPVKEKVSLVYMREHFAKFVQIYFQLFIKYPGDYCNAVLALDAGYLNILDTTHKDVYTWGASWLRTGWSPCEEVGLTQESKAPLLYQILEEFAQHNLYDRIPILGFFVMPGGYIWMILLEATVLLWKKSYRSLLIFAFPIGYFLTLLLGPTVQLRYIYTIMALVPFIFVGMQLKE